MQNYSVQKLLKRILFLDEGYRHTAVISYTRDRTEQKFRFLRSLTFNVLTNLKERHGLA